MNREDFRDRMEYWPQGQRKSKEKNEFSRKGFAAKSRYSSSIKIPLIMNNLFLFMGNLIHVRYS